MEKINVKRIVLGGLLAAVVLTLVHSLGEWMLASQLEHAFNRLGLGAPGEAMMLIHILGAVAVGTVAVWLYVALKTIYGSGPRTALLTGVTVWLLVCLVPNSAMVAMGMLTSGLAAALSAIDLVAFSAATLAGTSIYRDSEPRPQTIVTSQAG